MPSEPLEPKDNDTRDRGRDRDDDNRFSQDDDDKAGRAWHGLISEIEIDIVGRFEEAVDEDDQRPGRATRI